MFDTLLSNMNLNKKSGFTLVEIMIVVAIIALLAAVAIPNFVKSRAEARLSACTSNMRVIDAAIQQYLIKNDMGESDYGAVTISVLQEDEYLHKAPTCPASKGAQYLISTENGVECPASGSDYHGSYKNGIHTPPVK
jgi:prepilin-type N-terminal cleavage/methylation domain-containing protein